MHKTIVITGASDGIGAAAARQLHKTHHTVVLIGRSPEKTKAIAKELGAPYYIADFADLEQVRELGAKLRKNFPRIDILANNAGGIFGKREVTVDGFEKTLQVNHLAHFLLTGLLIDVLVKSKATVINTSSIAHQLFSRLDIADINMAKGYTSNKAYGNAKLCNILFTRELHRLFNEQGLSTASFHPGKVATAFAVDSNSLLRILYQTPLKYLLGLLTPDQGADTLVWLATTAPDRDWQSGQYYEKRRLSRPMSQAKDAQLASAIWKLSENMVGIKFGN